MISRGSYYNQSEITTIVQRKFEYLLPFIKEFIESNSKAKVTFLKDTITIVGPKDDRYTADIFLKDIIDILVTISKDEFMDSYLKKDFIV